MRQKLEYITETLEVSFDGKPWYGDSVLKKINEVDWRIVNDEIYGNKSIAVLLQHIINWRVFVIKKLQGDEEYDIIIDKLNDWTQISINSEYEWNQMKEDIRDSQKELLAILATCEDELLDKIVPGKTYSFGPILQSISQHDIYHLGQIAMLNSMRKS